MNGQASSTAVTTAASNLRTVFTATGPDDTAIRNAVCAFVDVVKPLGWPVERVLVEVKRIAEVEDGFLYQARLRRGPELRAAEAALERAVTWCIEHFFWTPLDAG